MKKKLYQTYRSMTRWVKRQIRNPRKRLVLEAVAVAAIIIAIISLVTSGKKVNTEGIKEGVSYIKSLEKKDTSEIEQEIKEIKRAERKAALESGEINVWAQFNDSVILGDSRAVGFEVFDCVDDSRVFADAGATIRKIPEYSGKKVNTEGIKEGVSYIKSLEKKDTSEIEQEIKEIKRAERKAALESGEINVWAQFNDSVILGDSRAVGFEVFDCVDDSRVFADAGATIRKIPEYIDGIKAVNPSSIILCFNDLSIGLWPTCEEYITEYDQMIQKLQEALPDATVYVNSIIPATDPAFQKSEKWREIPDWNEQLKAHFEETGVQKSEKWREIPDWNEQLKAHFEETGVPFIDITEEVEEHKDLYDVDGIHMRKEFYLYWGNAIIMEVTENE